MHACRNCKTELSHVFCDLGMSPPPNDYRRTLDAGQPVYELKAYVCAKCKLVQLPETVPCEEIFSDYPYFSSVAPTWVASRKALATRMINEFKLDGATLVVDIASNDGYYLTHFVDKGIPVLGVEPAANIAPVARELGIETDCVFFGAEYARDKGASATLIHAANVLAHVPDIHDFVQGFYELLAPDGVAVFEFPAVINLLKYTQFDSIYHEHYSYLSAKVVQDILEQHHMYVWRIEEAPSHGGSYRIFASQIGSSWLVEQSVADVLAKETAAGLDRLETYQSFQGQCFRVRANATDFLIQTTRSGGKVVGFGAPAKTTTFCNYAGFNQELIEYVVDDSPAKQGRYVPGTNIPIMPYELLQLDPEQPQAVIIFPWNLKEPLQKKLRDGGFTGDVVSFVPQLTIEAWHG